MKLLMVTILGTSTNFYNKKEKEKRLGLTFDPLPLACPMNCAAESLKTVGSEQLRTFIHNLEKRKKKCNLNIISYITSIESFK